MEFYLMSTLIVHGPHELPTIAYTNNQPLKSEYLSIELI